MKIPEFKNLEKMNLPLMDFVKEYIVKKSLLRGKIGGKLWYLCDRIIIEMCTIF